MNFLIDWRGGALLAVYAVVFVVLVVISRRGEE